jgi:hypothetical protein
MVPFSLLVQESRHRAEIESLFDRHCLELPLQEEPLLMTQELIVELLEEWMFVS